MDTETLSLLRQWRSPFADHHDQNPPRLGIRFLPGSEVNPYHPLAGEDVYVLLDGSGHILSIPAARADLLLLVLKEIDTYGLQGYYDKPNLRNLIFEDIHTSQKEARERHASKRPTKRTSPTSVDLSDLL